MFQTTGSELSLTETQYLELEEKAKAGCREGLKFLQEELNAEFKYLNLLKTLLKRYYTQLKELYHSNITVVEYNFFNLLNKTFFSDKTEEINDSYSVFKRSIEACNYDTSVLSKDFLVFLGILVKHWECLENKSLKATLAIIKNREKLSARMEELLKKPESFKERLNNNHTCIDFLFDSTHDQTLDPEAISNVLTLHQFKTLEKKGKADRKQGSGKDKRKGWT